jgi:ABC-type lipoprotein release transport system permease subunit
MMLHIAWRNLLRNKRRSAIIIVAIMFGLWGGLVASGVSFGLGYDTVSSALATRLSHVQIHAPSFRESRNIRDTLAGGSEVAAKAAAIPGVSAAAGRIVIEGMASTAETAVGVSVYGIDSEAEARVSAIRQRMIEGAYEAGRRRNTVIIGAELATKLGVRLRSKIVLTMQDVHGTIVGGSYRVAGIFRTDSKPFDEVSVFVDRRELSGLLGLGDQLHEVAIVLDDPGTLDSVAAAAGTAFPALRVETWKQLAPELQYINSYTEVYLEIFLGIIVLALLFGISNTMLMSVLDRVREFGVLTAIGMRGRKIFVMIMLESVVLSIFGAASGMAAGWGTVAVLQKTGINLSAFADGLRQYGYSEISYPIVPEHIYFEVLIAVLLAAVLGAIYPAWRAIRLDPARAIRTF